MLYHPSIISTFPSSFIFPSHTYFYQYSFIFFYFSCVALFRPSTLVSFSFRHRLSSIHFLLLLLHPPKASKSSLLPSLPSLSSPFSQPVQSSIAIVSRSLHHVFPSSILTLTSSLSSSFSSLQHKHFSYRLYVSTVLLSSPVSSPFLPSTVFVFPPLCQLFPSSSLIFLFSKFLLFLSSFLSLSPLPFPLFFPRFLTAYIHNSSTSTIHHHYLKPFSPSYIALSPLN